jgi:hypothetical protein
MVSAGSALPSRFRSGNESVFVAVILGTAGARGLGSSFKLGFLEPGFAGVVALIVAAPTGTIGPSNVIKVSKQAVKILSRLEF